MTKIANCSIIGLCNSRSGESVLHPDRPVLLHVHVLCGRVRDEHHPAGARIPPVGSSQQCYGIG